MAATKKLKSNNVYFSCMDGAFVQRVDEGTEDSKPRTLDSGKVVHEVKYKAVDGFITKCYSYEHDEYGHRFVIQISDDRNYVIEVPLSSGWAKSFLNKAENIHYGKPVELKPYSIEDKETKKIRHFITPYQEGEKVESVYTKENPGKLPGMKKTKLKGKETWDDSDQIGYYLNTIIPAIQEEIDNAKANVIPKLQAKMAKDDLPF